MDAKHTPGEMVQKKKNGRVLVIGEQTIATASHTPDNPPQAWANAAEIARRWNAFPDLLAACIELATAKNEPNQELHDLRIKSAKRMAEAALAKAKGGAA